MPDLSGAVGLCCCQAGSSSPRSPLAGCMSPRSQSKNPHARSFQLLNNTKQTVTYFQSREQAREKTRPGVRSTEVDHARRGGPGEPNGQVKGSVSVVDGRRGRKRCGLSPARERGAPCELRSPVQQGPGVQSRGLRPPPNVIKQAGTGILQRAPILEASLDKECSSQEPGLTHVTPWVCSPA